MKIKLCFFILLLLAANAKAQDHTLTLKGKLISAADRSPVKEASISLQGGKVQTLSAADGTFTINGRTANDTLIITHVNFSTVKIAVNNATALPPLISLQPFVKQLDEVLINTGYQFIPKERATGSFERIDNSLFNQQQGTTVLNRLEAVAGALYVDNKTNAGIVIRGLSSIQGPKQTLIILDDFPYEGDLNNINPNDVESISILRDAAAASIWGTRAGNGVIVITTKKGKFNQPLRVDMNNNIAIAQKPGLFYMKNISSSDFIDVEQFLYAKGYYNSMLNAAAKPPVSPVVELLVKKANGSISAADADAQINAMRGHDTRNDFNKYVYRNAVNRQHAINIRGGSNAMAWNFSAGLDQNTGSLDDKYNRITLRSVNTFKVSKNIQLSAGLGFTQSTTIAGRAGYNQVATANGKIPPYTQLADAFGNPVPVIKDYRQAYLDTAGAGKLLNWNYYPLDDHKEISNKNTITEFLASLGLSMKLFKGLTIDIKYQYQRQSSAARTQYGQQSYYARNLINIYSQLNRTTGVVTYKLPKGAILGSSDDLVQAHNVRAQLNFSRRLGLFDINAIAGSEIRQVDNSSNSFTTYGLNPDVLTAATVDFVNPHPSFITGNTSYIGNGINFDHTINRFISLYGNAAAAWKNKYTVSASARRDASNLFGVQTNEKWTPLWSTGLAWDISKEKFYRFAAIPYLKMRLSYGVSGNADPDRSAVTTIFFVGNSPYVPFQLPTSRIEQFANPQLRWEKVYMLNLGIDFSTKNDRLSGSLEYYRKKATDLFASSPVDYTSVATTFIVKNIATVQGRGFDLSLNSINLKRRIGWSTAFNLSFNNDKVKDYYRGNNQGSNVVGTGTGISAIEGRPVYALYAYRWAGLDPLTGDPQGYFKDQVSKDYAALTGTSTLVTDLVYIGPARPQFFGSMGNTLSWKGLSLTVRLSYKFGYYIRRSTINYSLLFANRNGHPDYALRWQKPGDEQITSVPSMVYPASSNRDNFYNNAEIHIQKGDHVRLQYITLSYTPNKLSQLLHFRSTQLYLNAYCPAIIWRANKAGIDPDYNETTILPPKGLTAGLKIEF